MDLDQCPYCSRTNFASESGRKVHINVCKRKSEGGTPSPKASRKKRKAAAAKPAATAPKSGSLDGRAMLTAALERARDLITECLTTGNTGSLQRARALVEECAKQDS